MSDHPFPPEDPAAFLSLCAGEWMSLRSRFALSDGDDDWHQSERGEVTVRFESSESASQLGDLVVQPTTGPLSRLAFRADGALTLQHHGEEQLGQWRFWADGSLELTITSPDGVLVQERIWFTRVNLRLRSTTAVDADGAPREGSFCTDIRRVSKPAA